MSLLRDGFAAEMLDAVLETRKKRGREVEALPHDVSLRERWGKNDPSCSTSTSLPMLTCALDHQKTIICIDMYKIIHNQLQ